MHRFDPIRRIHVPQGTSVYYPFGSTKSRNLFEKWFPYSNQETLQVLLLGCGDLRNLLHTIEELPDEKIKIHFHLNDVNPSVIAKNIYILHIISSSQFNPQSKQDIRFIWDVWYNFDWSMYTARRFMETFNEMEDGQKWKSYIPLKDNIGALQKVWEFYRYCMSVTDPELIAQCHLLRKSYLMQGMSNGRGLNKTQLQQLFIETTRKVCKSFGPYVSLEQSSESLMDSLLIPQFSFYQTGNIRPKNEKVQLVCVNPTLFQPHTQISTIHYKTTPLSSYFPIPNKTLKQNPDVVQYCHSVLSSRIAAFRKLLQENRIEVSFYVQDAVQFCLKKKFAPFDVVDTSSLADDFGLANLLLYLPPILRNQFSIAYTETLNVNFKTRREYLGHVLGVPSTMIPAIFGLRLLEDFLWGSDTPYGDNGRLTFLFRWTLPSWPTIPKPVFSLRTECCIQQCIRILENRCTSLFPLYSKSGLMGYTQLTLALILRSMQSRFDFDLEDALKQIKMSSELQFAWDTVTEWLLEGRILEFRAKDVPLNSFFTKHKCPSVITRPRLKLTTKPHKSLNSTVSESHTYIDNVRVDVSLGLANLVNSIDISFLIPEKHVFQQGLVSFQLYDMLSHQNISDFINLRDFEIRPFSGKLPLCTRPCPTVTPHSFYRSFAVEETEYCYVVLIEFSETLDSTKIRGSSVEILGNQLLPCRTVNQISVRATNSQQTPLVLSFSCPVVVGGTSVEKMLGQRFLTIHLTKITDEPWAEDFTLCQRNLAKVKVGNLPSWTSHCTKDTIMAHLKKLESKSMNIFSCGTFTTTPSISPSFFLADVIRHIFTLVSNDKNCFPITCPGDTKNAFDQGFFLRVHDPLIRYTREGSPLICLTVYDRQTACFNINCGLLDCKTTEADLKRIMPEMLPLVKASPVVAALPKLIFPAEKLCELRTLFRRNSLVMEPTEWQKKHVPIGPEQPWITTFLIPVYADNSTKLGPQVNSMLQLTSQPSANKVQVRTPANKCTKCRKQVEGSLKSCSKCRNPLYCSRSCQTRDWSVHKKSCAGP